MKRRIIVMKNANGSYEVSPVFAESKCEADQVDWEEVIDTFQGVNTSFGFRRAARAAGIMYGCDHEAVRTMDKIPDGDEVWIVIGRMLVRREN